MTKHSERRNWLRRRRRRAVAGGTARLTAPPSASASTAEFPNGAGIIRPNTQSPRLPAELAEPGEAWDFLKPGRVVLVIASLALIFIAIITWFIAHEPT
jgi:hypothetical protein